MSLNAVSLKGRGTMFVQSLSQITGVPPVKAPSVGRGMHKVRIEICHYSITAIYFCYPSVSNPLLPSGLFWCCFSRGCDTTSREEEHQNKTCGISLLILPDSASKSINHNLCCSGKGDRNRRVTGQMRSWDRKRTGEMRALLAVSTNTMHVTRLPPCAPLIPAPHQ